MLIDRLLPEYDETVVRRTVVDADSETTYRAMLDANLLDTGPVVRALGRLCDLPTALANRLSGTTRDPPPEELRFADISNSAEWAKLAEAPGEEFVFGAVGKFWQPDIEWRRVAPDEFAGFDDPGYAKLAVGLSVRPDGDGRTLLSYEARTATTSEEARRSFRRYWRVIGPFAGYLMARALDRIEADAEALAEEKAGDGGRRAVGRLAAIAGAATLAGAYHFAVRPWHRRWGTTDDEAHALLPGDDLLPNATDQVTHAVEIDAPVQEVWPWLVQIGQSRGGFYSYDWLENLVGADIHNADWILPDQQDLAEGDTVRLAPEDYAVSSTESAPEVALLEPERTLVLRPLEGQSPEDSPRWTWAFVLKPTERGTTRLLARMRSDPSRPSVGPLAKVSILGGALDYLFWEPAHFVMERKMLLGIKRRVETRKWEESPAAR